MIMNDSSDIQDNDGDLSKQQTPKADDSNVAETLPVSLEGLALQTKKDGKDGKDTKQVKIDASPLVDQVPLGDSQSALHRDSIAAMGSDISGTLGEETLDEQYFGPVVDHLPPPEMRASDMALSVTAQARYEDLDEESKCVEDDGEQGQTPVKTLNNNTGGPSVVDHVPIINDVPAVLKDSIFAVTSQHSGLGMEDAWREDFDPNEEDYGPVVDQLPPSQTPTQHSKSLRSSLQVHGAILEEDENDEDMIEKRNLIMLSGASVADSCAVVAPLAENEDEVNTVERTLDGTVDDTMDGIADDDTVSIGPRSINVNLKNEPVVDHVPLPGEGRPAGNSTQLVDRSEYSTVGDITCEDVQFGLVVDQTPHGNSATWQANAAEASIIVAATKSECPDDLEDDIDGETCPMGTVDDGATIDTSLGDQNLSDHKLVDHVPDRPGMHKRVNSSEAIAEAQSLTRDDEFGLVVDHTPIGALPTASCTSTSITRDSVGALANRSEAETLRSDEIRSLISSVGICVENE